MNKYNTNQRELILDYLIENKEKHITVDEVLYNLKTRGNSVGKATIYRYFELLLNDGKLRKYIGVDGKGACYQYFDSNNDCYLHYHLICDCCNELSHVKCGFLDNMNKHLQESHSFQINNSKTIFHGLCEKCAK